MTIKIKNSIKILQILLLLDNKIITIHAFSVKTGRWSDNVIVALLKPEHLDEASAQQRLCI